MFYIHMFLNLILYIYIYICINTESIQMASKEKQPILGKTKDMFQYMLPVLT